MMLTRFLLGYRGFLDDGRPRIERIVAHWKLDPAENFSRMRLRLAPLHHFDRHDKAARLRDNTRELPPSHLANLTGKTALLGAFQDF
jgi:hypothetical protein